MSTGQLGRLGVFWHSAVLLTLSSSPVGATILAHLRVEAIAGGCIVDDQDPFPLGDPERRYRFGIFDSNSGAVLSSCVNGCTADSNPATLDGSVLTNCSYNMGCGLWDFADQTLTKVAPANAGVYFYFGLFDEDDSPDQDDSLGDHWFFASGPSTGDGVANNNASPYNPVAYSMTVCDPTEGAGTSGNFELYYDAWFEDTSGPAAASNPSHNDDGGSYFWDNDSVQNFSWGLASDPDSGIASYQFDLWRDATGGYVLVNQPAPSNGALSICPAGCNAGYTFQHGETYQIRITAWNGNFPVISNPALSVTSWVQFGVDLVSPTSAFTAPGAGSWQGASFPVSATDSDSGSGLASCERQIVSNGVQTQTWSARTCGSGGNVTVGPALQCRDQGPDTCQVQLRSTDNSRRVASTAFRNFSIDWTGDAIATLAAFSESGGSALPAATWQPDATPYLTWSAAAGAAPVAGYSLAWDTAADCVSDGAATSGDFNLSDGQHQFSVRAIDEAGNCGDASTFDLWIDSAAEPVEGLEAFTEEGGDPIPEGAFQPDATPYFSWSDATSTSPVAGYSLALDTAPDCATETSLPEVAFDVPIPDGMHTFAVRAVDEAGNCGPVTSFELYVDSHWIFVDGFESGDLGAWSFVFP